VENIVRPLSVEDKAAYGSSGLRIIDFLIPSLIAMTIFQGAVMGMGRAVAGEKRDGSLTRVFLTPTSNTTIIVGTLLFYVLFELVRASFLIIFSVVVFNIKIQGSLLLIALILAIYIIVSTTIGMIISSIVKTEQQFQAIAMLVSLPTMFLSGVFFPLQAMPKIMQSIANFLPITYAADALRGVMVKALPIQMISYPLSILLLFLVIFVTCVVLVFKRDIE
jgi:ABC-2 type transport system permease protein